MTRDEQISEMIEKDAVEYDKANGGAYSMGVKDAYIDAFNSELFKDLQELAVIEGSIVRLKEVAQRCLNAHALYGYDQCNIQIQQLETTRQTLLTKLGLDE